MKQIAILCPTRGRIENMTNMVESAIMKAMNPDNLEFIFYIDNDDEVSYDHYRTMMKWWPGCIKAVVGERIVLSEMWNKCYEQAESDICMHGGDDLLFRTEGWDMVVLNQFDQIPDKIGFVYGNDGIQPPTFGTHGFLHKNWIKTVGYFVPPYFSSDYNDTWLNDVGYLINRKFHIDIMTEHMHYTAGKADIDQNTKDRLERHARDRVWEIYNTTGDIRRSDAEKLKEFIKNFKQ